MPSFKQKSLNEIPEVIERNSSPQIGYIRKHWRGELSLATSFWVNIFLLNIILCLLVAVFDYGDIPISPVIVARILIAYLFFTIVVVYPWQVIGMWRSCYWHMKIKGKYFWARTIQVLVVLGIIGTLGSLSSNWPVYEGLSKMAFTVDDEFGDYALKLIDNNTMIHLEGPLCFGVSKDVAKMLKENPKVEGIILDSIGGRVYEGRELAKLISTYTLDTYSIKGCYSAATIAFIAGEKRFLGIGANLAYHQYEAGYGLDTFVDMTKEQDKDLPFFRKQGVKSEFLDKLFHASHDDLWYPTVDEMLDAGVIHGIVNPSDLLPIKYDLTSKEVAEAFTDVDKAFLDIPLYKTIKKYDPDTYNKVVIEFKELMKKGATLIEMQRAGANIIEPLAFTAMPRTSDEALIQFVQTFIVVLKKLKEVNPILGLKALYPKQYGSVSFSEYLSDDKANLMLESLNKIIIDAYEKDNPSVDTEAAELLMYELIFKLGEYADYLELEGLQGTDDYGQHCDAVIKLYENILEEDKIAAGNILRYMFSPE